jgi:hypothetical protein
MIKGELKLINFIEITIKKNSLIIKKTKDERIKKESENRIINEREIL